MDKKSIVSLGAMALFTAVMLTPDPVHAQTNNCDAVYARTVRDIPETCVGKATSSLALKSPQCTPVTCPTEYREEYNDCLRDDYSRATRLQVQCEQGQLRAPAQPREATGAPPPVRSTRQAWGCAAEGLSTSIGDTMSWSYGDSTRDIAAQEAMGECRKYPRACQLVGCARNIHSVEEAQRRWPRNSGHHSARRCREVPKPCFSFAPHSECVTRVCD
jgi:hypothetical protein